MGRNDKILLANFLKSSALLFKGFFALSFVLLSACGGGRGGSEDANGNPIGLGLEIRKVSGDNQGVKKGLAYPLPLVAKITAPDGYPVPDMTVDCTEITNTDAVITGPTSFVTDTSGIISTTVLAASTYDQTTKIECRIRNSPNLAVFTLETVFTVDRIEWADSGAPDPTPINPPNEPPAVYTASHNVPMTPFQVKMIDADDGVSLIDLTGGTRHWITVSAVSPAQAPIGTLTATFQAGFAEFSNVNYIKADTITLRATHNVSGKTVDKVITINPNATTRSIAILPGQTYTNGTMTLAEAVTGVLGAFNVDNNFNVEVRATDDYFNTTSYGGAVSLQSPNDLADTEPAASNFVAGVETFTMSPVQAKSGYTVLPVTALTDNASTAFTMQPGAPANLITRLPGQTFNPGQTSLAAAITGAPTQQVAGATFAPQVIATDAEFNMVNAAPSVSVTTTDPSDTHPANKNLVAGTTTFNITDILIGNWSISAASAGYTTMASDLYNVKHNAATQIVITTQPASPIIAGANIEPIAEIRDAYGNLVSTGPDSTANVIMTLFSGTGALAGTVTTAAVGGVANFTGVGAYANLIGAKVVRLTKADTTGSSGTIARSVNTNSFTINHAPAATFVWTTQPASTGAGLEIAPVLEIRDAYTNLVTTSDDATALVTMSMETGSGVLAGTVSKNAVGGIVNFTGTGMNTITKGTKTIRATKADTSGGTGTASYFSVSNSFYIDHGTATQIVFATEPTNPTAAGTELAPIIEIQDSYGNVVDTGADATASVAITLQTGTGSLLGLTSTTAVAGVANFTGLGAYIDTVGAKTLRATKAVAATGILFDDSAAFNIIPGPLASFTVAGITDPHVAGTTTSPVVTAFDTYGNTKTNYTGTITFTSDDGAAVLPAPYTFVGGDSGTHTFTGEVQLKTTGDKYVRVTDGSVNAQQSAITVTPAALASFTVTGITDPHVAGTTTSPVVTAKDTYGNIKTNYTGTITFTSDDGIAVLPTPYTFVGGDSGVHTFTNLVTLKTTGDKYVQVASGAITAQQTAITVTPAALASFTITGITDPHVAGTTTTPIVTAFDTYNNIKTNYTGTITFTSDDGAAVLPSPYTFVGGDSGVHTFTNEVTLKTTGDKYVRVASGAITAQQTAITVTPAALASFTVTGITDPHVAGTTTTPVVTAKDTYGNTKTNYTGTITFTSDDGIAVLPTPYTFVGGDSGVHTFTNEISLRTTGDKYVQVADGAITAQQTAITVTPAALASFTVAGITDPHVAGTTTTPVVTALDTYGNIKTNYTGTITFTSDDGAAVLPSPYTFVGGDSGVHTFTNLVTLKTTGDKYVQVASGVITAQQTAITVTPAALGSFTITGITDPHVAGTTTTPVVTALDTLGNIKTNYTGTITFTSDDGIAVLPTPYTFVGGDNGVHTFTNEVTLKTTGDKYVQIADGAITAQQTAITVTPAALGSFTVTGIADPHSAGSTTTPVVTALDTYGNTKTNYTGTITFTSDDGAAVLPSPYTFVGGDNGVHTFTNLVTLKTTGDKYVQVTSGAITAQQTAITVTPAALGSFTITGITDPHVAGTTTTPVVTALDTLGNIKTDYTGTITFTSDDGAAVLPSPYTFVGGDSGVHTFTNEVTLKTTGDKYVQVASGAITAQQTAITVTPAALGSFTITGITDPHVAGTTTTPVVTAKDTYGNTKTNYTGTITFTSDDGIAVLPSPYTFVGGDSGVHTFTNEVTLKSTGDKYVQVADGAITAQQTAITVTPSALGSFTITGITDPHVAGTTTTPVVTAKDTYGNTKTNYTGTITFTSDDGAAVLPTPYTFVGGDNGVHTFTNLVTLKTTGDKYVQVADGAVTAQQTAITVTPAALGSFTITGITDPHSAGTTTSPVVTAKDTYGNTKTNYTGTITFTSDDGAAVLPSPYTFVGGDNGVHTFTNEVTLKTTGDKYVQVADGAVTAQQTAITVTPAALGSFTITGITDPHAAGTTTSPVVTAKDTFGNTKTNYTGTITFTSDDGAAVLPAPYTFVGGDSGVHTFTNEVTLKTTGDKYVQVADGAITAQQTAITVNPAALGSFAVVGISDPVVAGSAETVSVTAYDTEGNIKTDYVGTITFSSDDGSATLPSSYTFVLGDVGSRSFVASVTLKTTGDKYVRATDGAVNGQQSAITVTPAALGSFTITGITDPHAAGTTTTPVVTAKDTYGNTKTNYTGTITFTSDDVAAVLPSPYTFVGGDSGVHTFTNEVQLKTTGEKYVQVADGAVTAQQTAITVTPAALGSFTIAGITDPHAAGTATSPVVTAKDTYGNIKTNYTGTITFTSDDGIAVLPSPYTFVGGDSGVHTFTGEVQLKTTGDKYVQVADGAVTAQQTAITVTPAALGSFTVTGITDPHAAGTTTSPVVTAYDTLGNVKADYTGTITFTSDDGAAVLPSPYTFVGGDSGVHTFTNGVTLKTTGDKYVQVADGAVNGQQSAITVTPAALGSFTIVGITDPHAAGTTTSPVVTAYDTLGNVKTNYTGTITFTSDDGAAVLPSPYTFVGGDNGVHTFTNEVTLKTTGDKYVQVADGAVTAQQTAITVTPAALGSFAIVGITDPHAAGTTTSPVVTAKDTYGNTKTNYTGTITFTSDDGAAVLPSPYTFVGGDSGVHTFTGEVQLKTTGDKYVQVADGAVTAQQTAITVTPAALGSFTITGITDPHAAGTTTSPVVTAKDTYGNTKTNYTGTITFTSDDVAAVLPSPYTFVGGDNGVHTFTNEVTLKTTGDKYVQIADGAVTAQQTAITVTPAALGSFTITGITDPHAAGTTTSPVVTAKDTYGNTKTNYTGTITFTSDDVAAVLPSPYTFVGGDNGVHTFTNEVTLKTTGDKYVQIADGAVTAQQTAITVTPAALGSFTITGITDPHAAGTTTSPVVTAKDTLGNTKTDYTGTITFTSDDGAAVLPSPYTFVGGDSGVHTFTNEVTLKTTGDKYVQVADGAVTAQQTAITVTPAALGSFTITGITDPHAAGTTTSPVVTAKDTYGNTKTNYTGTITFTSDDGSATLPSPYTFVGGDSGVHTFTNEVTLKTTGDKYVQVVDGAVTAQQTAITVNPAALGSFTVVGISDPVVAGSSETVTVTAYDSEGNIKTDYVGTITFSSDDGSATLPSSYTFVGGDVGAHTFITAVTLETTGDKYVRVTDGAVTGQQSAITVTPSALGSFTITGITDPHAAGTTTTPVVTAKDTYGNTKTNYTGTITFTSDDVAAVLPSPYTFVGGDSGVHTFTNEVTLKTTGDKYVQIADGAVTAQQTAITVTPAALGSFTITGITDPHAAGTTTSPVVTAKDTLGNTKTDYTGTITFTSDDGAAVLPSPYTFVGGDNGVHTFTNEVTLKTTGDKYVQVADGAVTAQQTAITVTPAALGSFTITGITDPHAAGTTTSPVVTAKDTLGNTKTDYTGTITFTSDDGAAVLPSPYTFVGGDSGVHTFTNEVTLKTTGDKYVQVADGAVTAQQTAITVTPAALGSFTITGITDPHAAGTTTSPVVTAKDTYGNTKTNYTGTITFTSDDGIAVLPTPYTFVGGDSGVHTFTNEVTLKTTGDKYVQVADGAVTAQQTAITVTPAALGSFTVTGITDPHVAGTTTTPVVTAKDTYGNTKTNYTGTITFTSDDGAAVLPSPYTFVGGDSGVHTFTNEVTLKTTGDKYVQVADGAVTAQQTAITVNPAALASFTITGITDPHAAGTTTTPVVTAKDTYGNTKTNYTGTITFTSDDGAAVLPSPYTFVGGDNGVHTFTNEVTLKTTGDKYVQVADGAITAQQTAITVNPAALGSFTITGITDPHTAGTTTSPVVTAKDTLGNTKTDYVGTITFTSDDGSAVLPSPYTFVGGDNGVHTFTNEVTLKTTGDKYVQVADGAITAQQTAITVNPAALGSFTVVGISDPVVAGSLETVTVTAYDSEGNIKTDYVGTITFSSDDGAATLPSSYTFVLGDVGTHSFVAAVSLETTGDKYVRVTDGAVSGQQSAITVTPAALGSFTITGITDPHTAGTTTSPVVTAKDTYGNTKTNYTGTITFTSDDGAAVLPSPYTFVGGDSGVHTFTNEVTLKTTGDKYVQVADGAVTAQQTAITVTPAALGSFTVTGITDPHVAGTTTTPVVTAKDTYGNTKTNYTGTITFTSDDVAAVLPSPYTFVGGDSGVHTFTNEVTLKTTGDKYVQVADGAVTAQQTAITVTPAALASFTITGITDPHAAGTTTTPVVTAKDTYGNTKTNYTGTITFTSDDVAAVLPSPYTFVGGDNGAHTFTNEVTLKTTGDKYVQVADGAITAQQTAITVTPAALGSFTITGITDPHTAGTTTTPVVTAKDTLGNTKTDYVGTITFTSDDGAAVLPSPYTFVGGDSGVHTFTNEVTLKTTGDKYVQVADGAITAQQTAITVTPAALGSFTITGITDPHAAGTTTTPVVTAKDTYGNTKTNYTGTITFTSDDGAAVLPSPYTFVGGDSGVHTFTNEVTLKTTGDKYVQVADGAITAQQTAITVTPAALGSFTITGITDPHVAGTTTTPVVTAKDTYGNTKTNYTGTITFTSDDGAAVLPSPYTFVGGDSGVHTFTNEVTLKTTGDKYVQVADGAVTAQQTAITVTPAALGSFTVTGITDPHVAGTTTTPVVTAKDTYGNTKTNYTGTITFTSDDGSAVLPSPYTFVGGDSGVHTFTNEVTLKTTGDKYVQVADGAVTAQQTAITVTPAALASFTITGITDPHAAGTTTTPVVTAKDTYGNTKTNYTGTITFTSDDVSAVLPSPYTFVGGDNGAHTFTNEVTLKTTGDKYVQVADGAITAQQTAITVTPAALGSFTITGITDPHTAGTTTTPVVTAKDTYGNTKTNYTGTITFTSDDGAAVLPSPYTFVGGDSGVHTFTNEVTLKTTGDKYVQVADGAITAQQTAITVTPAALGSFTITGITDPHVAGTTTTPVVTAKDTYGNTKTNYTGTITFTSDDVSAVLPSPYTFVGGDNGAHTFTNEVTLKTTGDKYVQVADGAVTAQQTAITVTPAALGSFTITGITDPHAAGTTTSPVVTAKDTYGNTKTNYTGTITFTSDDGSAVLPSPYTFVGGDNGVHTFTNEVTLKTTGDMYVQVDDGGITAQQTAITVNPGAAASLVFNIQPSSGSAGSNLTPEVEIHDAYGNIKSDDSTSVITLTIQTNPGSSTLSGDVDLTVVGGVATWTATEAMYLNKVGTGYVLRASDGTRTVDSSTFNVTHGAINSLSWTTQPSSVQAGTYLVPAITALDAHGNTVTSDSTTTITLSIQTNPSAGTLSGDVDINLASGIATWTGTEAMYINKAGTGYVLRATDGSHPANSASFNVTAPAAPSGLALKVPASSPSLDVNPEITVSGVVNGYTVNLFSDACTTAAGSGAATGTSIDLTQSPDLASSNTYNYYATQTDTYGNESACSVATLAYTLDITAPNAATALTLASTFAPAVSTSPLFTWTASGSGDVASHKVGLSTTSGNTDLTSGWITPDTGTSHTFSGITFTECSSGTPVYYPTTLVTDNVGNTTQATHGSGFRYDVTDPSAISGLTNGLDANSAQTPTHTWTAATDNCELSHYEIAVGVTSGGIDRLAYTAVGNNTTTSYQAVNGIDGVTLSLSAGTYYYTSIKAVDKAGRKSSVVTSAPWRYIVPPDAITNLAYSNRTSNTIEVSWSAPNNNGTPITDYNVQYRLSVGPGAWVDFADGVSTDTTVNITGLASSTSYDIRIRAYNGGAANWSNIAVIETAINDPFFAPDTFTAFNLGGATTGAVVALEDYTIVTQTNAGGTVVFTGTINAGQTAGLTSTTVGDIIEADKPFYVAGRRAAGTAAAAKNNIVFNVPEWADKSFVVNASRQPNHIITIYAFEAADVTITGSSAPSPAANPFSMVAGQTQSFAFTPSSGSWDISSTGLITAYQYSENGGSNVVDGMPILPPSNDIIGVPSCTGGGGSCWVTTTGTSVSTDYWYGTSNSATNIILDNGTLSGFPSTAAAYAGAAVRFISQVSGLGTRLAGRSTGDGNGSDSAPFIPVSMMRKRYAINVNSTWTAFSSTEPAVIRVFNASGYVGTNTLTRTGTHANAPYHFRRTGDAAGTIYESDTRFAAWYEPSVDVNASSQDETILFGTDGKGLPVNHELKMWLDSSDGSTLWQNSDCATNIVTTNGQSIGCWKDKSYQGNNAIQTGGNKPVWQETVNTFGGRGGVDFDGTTNYLNFAQSIVTNTNYTVIAVIHRDSTANDQYFMGTQSLSVSQGLHLGFSADTNATAGHDGSNILNNVIEGQANNSVGIFWARLSAGGKKVYFNADTGTHVTATKLASPGQGVIGLGRDTNGFNGQIAELIVYDRDLQDSEIDLLEKYLRDKWLNPNQVPNMRLWLDASDTNSLYSNVGCSTTITTGGNVRCWGDKSGSGYQAVQSGTSPTWNLDGSRSAVQFSNANLKISAGGVGALFDTGQTVGDMTVLTLARSTNASENGYLIYHPAGASVNASIPYGANTVRMQMNGSGSGGELQSTSWGGGIVVPYIWSFMNDFTGGAQSIYRDGNLVTSDASADQVTIGTGDFYIGSDTTPANYQNANVHELYIFRRVLSTDERAMIRAYLMNKWDL